MARNVVEAVAYGGVAIMLYHYAIYPLIVWGMSRFLPSPAAPNRHPARVTLVIAAFNEEKVIEEKLKNSLAIDYPDLEILVAADGSSDDTVDIAGSYAEQGVKVLFEPERRGKASALNRAVIQATGEIIVLSDANAMYAPHAIRSLVAEFSTFNVGAVSGIKVVRSRSQGDSGFGRSEGFYWKYENAIRRAESRIGTTVAAVGEIVAIRKDIFRPFPAGIVNDDAYLALTVLSQGFDVRFAPAAIAEELSSINEKDEYVRRRRIAAGRWAQLRYVKLLPFRRPFVIAAFFSHKVLRLVMPFALLLSAISSVLLATLEPESTQYLLLSGAYALLFGAALYGMYQQNRRGIVQRLSRICFFLISMNVSLAFGFLDWIRGNVSPVWKKAAR
ncbi:glycosyltransferase family 2 protein [Microvirga sp. ACRRW]|uniref:glycosyltransferase family 2 protein n=1 Tax=Microvirga sp. ACRRW TaxID=2918205 RepID=UPI001EF6C097|nr:glycosyltransferase family 2 protein [Microvirga sp. ACRRW]MCG7391579.1 glycosyltransferase family 2 protein [Microvirga sp. ACRRW]